MTEVLITAIGAALVTVIGNVVMFILQRKANKEDKSEKKIAEKVSQLEKENREQNKNSELMHEGLLALLKDRLFQACRYYIGKGDISIEELENVNNIFKAYSSLGGNGTGKKLYESVQSMFENNIVNRDK